MERTAFFVSDGTGITAENLGHSLLSQFGGIKFNWITLPYIDTVAKAQEAVAQINATAEQDTTRPIIFDTIIDQAIRVEISKANGFILDIFSAFLAPLEKELATASSYTVGQSHAITDESSYKVRIEAVHFALDGDDGARTTAYDKADVILTGVSRSGKTPTCLYLALQFGIRAANYPITEDDLGELCLPKALRKHKNKLFGLTIDSERLAAIRNERKANSQYANLRQCELELREVEGLFRKEGIPFLNITHFSIEEISTKILAETGITRRLQ